MVDNRYKRDFNVHLQNGRVPDETTFGTGEARDHREGLQQKTWNLVNDAGNEYVVLSGFTFTSGATNGWEVTGGYVLKDGVVYEAADDILGHIENNHYISLTTGNTYQTGEYDELDGIPLGLIVANTYMDFSKPGLRNVQYADRINPNDNTPDEFGRIGYKHEFIGNLWAFDKVNAPSGIFNIVTGQTGEFNETIIGNDVSEYVNSSVHYKVIDSSEIDVTVEDADDGHRIIKVYTITGLNWWETNQQDYDHVYIMGPIIKITGKITITSDHVTLEGEYIVYNNEIDVLSYYNNITNQGNYNTFNNLGLVEYDSPLGTLNDYALVFTGCTGGYINNVSIRNTIGNQRGIYLRDTKDVIINDCTFIDMYENEDIVIDSTCSNIKSNIVSGNIVDNANGTGTYIVEHVDDRFKFNNSIYTEKSHTFYYSGAVNGYIYDGAGMCDDDDSYPPIGIGIDTDTIIVQGYLNNDDWGGTIQSGSAGNIAYVVDSGIIGNDDGDIVGDFVKVIGTYTNTNEIFVNPSAIPITKI